jgi:hypothetical protein
MVSPRVQCWAVWLRTYEYRIIDKPGRYHGNADALSRLPVPEIIIQEEENYQVLMIDVLDDAPVNTAQIRQWTSKDVMLSQVHEFILKGWPTVTEPQIMPYYTRHLVLSVLDGCVLWGSRVVIHQKGGVCY